MKSMFKKITALLMALMLLFVTFGCSSDSAEDGSADENKVEENIDGSNAGSDYDGSANGNSLIVRAAKSRKSIVADQYHVAAVKADGTVLATEHQGIFLYYGQSEVDGWTNVIAISAGSDHTIGLKADGTLVASSSND